MTTTNTIKFIKILGLAALVSMMVTSCKKKDKEEEVTPDPVAERTTYDFTSIDTLASKQAIAMLGELTTYIRTTHSATLAPVLDVQKLRNLYENTNDPFKNTALNTSGFNLKAKTGNAYGQQADFDANFLDAITASQTASTSPTTSTASDGVAGKLINGTRYLLVDKNGFEYKEYVEKNIMGAVFYYQATELLNKIASFDNAAVANNTTAQQRAWDQAFGYFGVPINFPTVTTGLKNWGSYCNAVNGAIGSNATIMNAWIKGRAAIGDKNIEARDAARDIVVKTWEKVGAARFIAYAKLAKVASTPADISHNLSEAVGFIRAFKYNSAKTISNADIDILLGYFTTSGEINLYKVTPTNIDNAIVKMATIFNIDASKL